MNLQIMSGRTGRVLQFDLKRPKTMIVAAASMLLVVGVVFAAGVQIGRFVAGPLDRAAVAREMEKQRLDLAAVRGQMQGTVDALAARIGTLNAHLIRLDALGRRVTDLAGLDRGEFNFDEPPPAGGPDGGEFASGSAQVPDLTVALDTLEAQLEDRQRQLTVLESLMSTRSLGERILPGGWPIIGGWISSHFGYRADPFTGRGALHDGVDFAGPKGAKVIATGAGYVSNSGTTTGTSADYVYSRHILNPAVRKTFGFSFETGPNTGNDRLSFQPAVPEPGKNDTKAGLVALIQQSVCATELIGETLQAGTVQSIRDARDELLVSTEKGRGWIEVVTSVQADLLGIVLSDKTLTRRAMRLLARVQKLTAKRGKTIVSARDVEDGMEFLELLKSRVTRPDVRDAISMASRQLKKAAGLTVEANLKKLARSNPPTL